MYTINAQEIGFDFALAINMNREPRNEQEWARVSEFVEATFPLSADDASHGYSQTSCAFNFEEDEIEELEEEIRVYGAQYEIEVYEADETDLAHTIVNALYHGEIKGDDRDGIGMYQRENKSHSIFVDPSDLGEAVAIINALGFQTDEDEE